MLYIVSTTYEYPDHYVTCLFCLGTGQVAEVGQRPRRCRDCKGAGNVHFIRAIELCRRQRELVLRILRVTAEVLEAGGEFAYHTQPTGERGAQLIIHVNLEDFRRHWRGGD